MARLTGDRIRAALAVALLAVGAVWLWGMQGDRERLADDLAASGRRVDDLGAAVTKLSGQVDTLGGQPSVELRHDEQGPKPVDVPGPQGPEGKTGPPPSNTQVRAAVAAYCGTHGCTGPTGPAPTATQVAAAVAAYCDSRGRCQGPAGAAGTPGATGPAGDAGTAGETGPQGPAPSGDQIAAAVDTYCTTHDGCRGPAGADGQPGPAGATGDPGPTCPDGANPITWTVDDPHAAIIGLDPGTYLVCRAPS